MKTKTINKMKITKFLIDVGGALTILGLVLWLIIVTCIRFLGITLDVLACIGLTSFCIAAICFIVAGIIYGVRYIILRKIREE